MREPRFLSFDNILDLHQSSLDAFGGINGIRDEGGLRSAIGQPQNDYHYGGADDFAIAAAYAFHISQAQAFFDGNKRTAIGSAIVYLEQLGYSTDADPLVLYDAMIGVAEKRLDKAGLAELFRGLFS